MIEPHQDMHQRAEDLVFRYHYALDSQDRLVHISQAKITREYFCALCGAKMLVVEGEVGPHHFSHKREPGINPCSPKAVAHATMVAGICQTISDERCFLYEFSCQNGSYQDEIPVTSVEQGFRFGDATADIAMRGKDGRLVGLLSVMAVRPSEKTLAAYASLKVPVYFIQVQEDDRDPLRTFLDSRRVHGFQLGGYIAGQSALLMGPARAAGLIECSRTCGSTARILDLLSVLYRPEDGGYVLRSIPSLKAPPRVYPVISATMGWKVLSGEYHPYVAFKDPSGGLMALLFPIENPHLPPGVFEVLSSSKVPVYFVQRAYYHDRSVVEVSGILTGKSLLSDNGLLVTAARLAGIKESRRGTPQGGQDQAEFYKAFGIDSPAAQAAEKEGALARYLEVLPLLQLVASRWRAERRKTSTPFDPVIAWLCERVSETCNEKPLPPSHCVPLAHVRESLDVLQKDPSLRECVAAMDDTGILEEIASATAATE